MAPDLDSALDDDIGDDLLRLIFTSCHPILSPEARAALTLRLVGGLTTDEIAKAYLAAEPTIQQRIVRAKKTIAEAHIPFEVPRGEERKERIEFGARGHLPRSSTRATPRPPARAGCGASSATRRCGSVRILTGADARRARGPRPRRAARNPGLARCGADQRRRRRRSCCSTRTAKRWDRILIRRGLTALERAEKLGDRAGPTRCRRRSRPATRGPARRARPTGRRSPRSMSRSARSRRRRWSSSTARWPMPSPSGRRPGSSSSTSSPMSPRSRTTTCCPSVRGDFLFKLGRKDEARSEFERAAAMTRNERENGRCCWGGQQPAAKPPGIAYASATVVAPIVSHITFWGPEP